MTFTSFQGRRGYLFHLSHLKEHCSFFWKNSRIWEQEADKIWDSLFDFIDFDFQPDCSGSELKDDSLPPQP